MSPKDIQISQLSSMTVRLGWFVLDEDSHGFNVTNVTKSYNVLRYFYVEKTNQNSFEPMSIFKFFKPPPEWKFAVVVLLGILTGISGFIFYLSKAPSYLSDKPETCVNCHIMAPQYATWSHSAHRGKAHCNDCHVPHNNFVNKYFFKAKDGIRHATMFTLRLEPQVIQIKHAGKKVVQDNCIRCHKKLLVDDAIKPLTVEAHSSRSERKCWECHRETPHGRVNSLTSVPFARVPVPESPVPDWLRRSIKKEKNLTKN